MSFYRAIFPEMDIEAMLIFVVRNDTAFTLFDCSYPKKTDSKVPSSMLHGVQFNKRITKCVTPVERRFDLKNRFWHYHAIYTFELRKTTFPPKMKKKKVEEEVTENVRAINVSRSGSSQFRFVKR